MPKLRREEKKGPFSKVTAFRVVRSRSIDLSVYVRRQRNLFSARERREENRLLSFPKRANKAWMEKVVTGIQTLEKSLARKRRRKKLDVVVPKEIIMGFFYLLSREGLARIDRHKEDLW